MMALAVCDGVDELIDGGVGGGTGGVGGGTVNGISHKPLSVRRPTIIILLFFTILTLNRENMPMQSSSHSCPSDINDPVFILSNMITC